MGRYYIDSEPVDRDGKLFFRCLVEDGNQALWIDHEFFAKLIGVERVDPKHIAEGNLFVANKATPHARMTDAQKKMLQAMLGQIADQLPPKAIDPGK